MLAEWPGLAMKSEGERGGGADAACEKTVATTDCLKAHKIKTDRNSALFEATFAQVNYSTKWIMSINDCGTTVNTLIDNPHKFIERLKTSQNVSKVTKLPAGRAMEG